MKWWQKRNVSKQKRDKKKRYQTKWRQEGKVSELNGDKNEIYIHKLGKLIKNIKK